MIMLGPIGINLHCKSLWECSGESINETKEIVELRKVVQDREKAQQLEGLH